MDTPRHSSRADNATVLARIQEVRGLLDKQEQTQQRLLTHLASHEAVANDQSHALVRIEEGLKAQDRSGQSLLTTARNAFGAIIQVKGMLTDLAEKVIQLQVVLSNSIYVRGLDPTTNLPITLEDALGTYLTLPEDWIDDWEVSCSLDIALLFVVHANTKTRT